MRKTAVIDETGKYRYLLTRTWDESNPPAVFIMLNPSTADAEQDDPTIRRCIDFARRWDCGGIRVVNVFAFRATDPKELCKVKDPIGPDNFMYIKEAIMNAGIIIAAWGAAGPKMPKAYEKVFEAVEESDITLIHCLGLTKSGHPRHPLYLSKTTLLKQMAGPKHIARKYEISTKGDVMKRFICTSCGKFSYSSASLENARNNKCIYPGCGGTLIPADENQKCRVCGCTWDHACPGGCYWVEPDLCSKCAGK